MQFVITIDTESDNQWDPAAPITTHNIAFIPRFQALCDRFDFPPTYLCTYEVVADPLFDDVLLPLDRAGRAEIGAHLHPWTTPPSSPWDRSETGYAYPSELPVDIFETKLANLTDLLSQKLGRAPTSYRAGRWGFAAPQVPILVKLGYIVDCSVTPNVNWTDKGARERGQDFSDAPVAPYVLAAENPSRPGRSGLLEVPVTIVHTNGLMRRSSRLRAAYRRHRKSWVARGLNRTLSIAPRWFRPFSDMSVERLQAVYRTAKQLGLPAIEMMFHSSELMPGGSPHNLNEESVDRLFVRLERTFEFLARDGVRGATLSAFANEFSSKE